MFSPFARQPFCRLAYLFINPSSPISKPAIHPARWLPGRRSRLVALNFKWLQFSPLIARRSGRQHVGEGGPRRAACSGGVLLGRGEAGSITTAAMCSFSFLIIFGGRSLIWGCAARLIVPSSLLARAADGGAAFLGKTATSALELALTVNVRSAAAERRHSPRPLLQGVPR